MSRALRPEASLGKQGWMGETRAWWASTWLASCRLVNPTWSLSAAYGPPLVLLFLGPPFSKPKWPHASPPHTFLCTHPLPAVRPPASAGHVVHSGPLLIFKGFLLPFDF